MKKITYVLACIALAVIFFFGLTSCVFSGNKDYSETTGGRFIEISGQDNLYYDTNTKVVYVIWNEADGIHNAGYGYMSPYYSSNGLPYSYNIDTGYLEETHG